jgi:ribonuclease D
LIDFPAAPFELLTTSEQVSDVVKLLREQQRIAVDTESNGRHKYPESVCLVQFATDQKVYLIDALAVKDMTSVGEVLADDSVTKVMQAAENDVRVLDREWGFSVKNIFDTYTAARFAGFKQLGLSALAETLLGVRMQKDARIQKSDWTRRPLKQDSLKYAAMDVWHLLDIQRRLESRLQALQRLDWVSEECALIEKIRYVPRNPDVAYLSLKGLSDLNGQEKAVARRLFAVRESEARRRGIPPYYVLPHETLVTLASNPEADLAEMPSTRIHVRSRFGKQLREAIRRGLADPQNTEPDRTVGLRTSAIETERLKHLKNWRRVLAGRLSIDESLVWPTKSLDRLARAPDKLDIELQSTETRKWQALQFSASLRALLNEIGRRQSSGRS